MTSCTVKKNIPISIVLIFFLLWITPGLVGRDLWKADEPYSFGMVNHIVKTGDWVVPTLAGEPFMEKPPLLYITAAGFVRLFSPWLAPHDASRLATAFYMLLCALFLGLAARELLGKGFFGITIVILIGSAGLQETAHKLITDIAMLAGISIALYGFSVSRRRSVLGGILIGTGAGIGFLSKGLLAPGMLGIIALVLPIIFAAWRTKSYAQALGIALAASLPWFITWPLALYLRSPELFHEWLWTQNIGRFLSNSLVGQRHSPAYYLTQLPYFALPSLPLALWAVWSNRRSWRDNAGVQLSLTAFLVMLIVLSFSSSIRDIYALPMLLPLALLAAAGTGSVSSRVGKMLSGAILCLFGVVACLLWAGWLSMLSGFPSSFANRLYSQQPDYVPAFIGLHFIIACLYTGLWLFAAARLIRFNHSYLVTWTSGIMLACGLLMTLWLPWFESGSGYRAMFTSLKEKIPSRCQSIMSWGLGESERALLEYYTGVIPKRIEQNGVSDCDLVLAVSGRTKVEPPIGPGWQVVWEQKRPAKPGSRTKEIYTLLEREKDSEIKKEARK